MSQRRVNRNDLIEGLAETSHKTWMRQKTRDQGVPRDELDPRPTDHDRERAADTVEALEKLGLYGRGPRAAWLRHPLFVGAAVAVVSALFASWLIPGLTRVAQDRPKELEVKRGIVERIATSTADTTSGGVSLGRGDFRAAGGGPKDTRIGVWRLLSRQWRSNAAVVEAELTTYFVGRFPELAWRGFAGAVDEFLYLAASRDPQVRANAVHRLKHYFTTDADLAGRDRTRYERIDWDRLRREASFSTPLQAIATLLFHQTDLITFNVVKLPADGFKHSAWPPW